jgi:hypothetical protein
MAAANQLPRTENHHFSRINPMETEYELTPEQAGRMSATALASDLEYWARTASVDGRVGLNDLTRVLDVIREASIPDTGIPEA